MFSCKYYSCSHAESKIQNTKYKILTCCTLSFVLIYSNSWIVLFLLFLAIWFTESTFNDVVFIAIKLWMSLGFQVFVTWVLATKGTIKVSPRASDWEFWRVLQLLFIFTPPYGMINHLKTTSWFKAFFETGHGWSINFVLFLLSYL